jgi:hypothetical protein
LAFADVELEGGITITGGVEFGAVGEEGADIVSGDFIAGFWGVVASAWFDDGLDDASIWLYIV